MRRSLPSEGDLQIAWATEIAPRIGVETGEVVVDDANGSRPVRGDPIARSLRLSHAARAGEILLGETAYRLVQHAVIAEADPQAAADASGIAGRRRLLAVLAEAPALARRLDAPLVGRDGELSALRVAFDRAASGPGLELVTVLGDAGVGKSRLARELAASLTERGDSPRRSLRSTRRDELPAHA